MIVHINYLLKQVNPSHFWCILTRHCFTCLLLYFDHQSKYVDKIDMRKLYSLTVKFMKLNTNNDNLKRYKRSSAIWCIYIYIYYYGILYLIFLFKLLYHNAISYHICVLYPYACAIWC